MFGFFFNHIMNTFTVKYFIYIGINDPHKMYNIDGGSHDSYSYLS